MMRLMLHADALTVGSLLEWQPTKGISPRPVDAKEAR